MNVDGVWLDEVVIDDGSDISFGILDGDTDMDTLDRDGEPVNEESTVAMTPIKQIVIICGLIFFQDFADKMSFQGSLIDKDSVSSMAQALSSYHKVPVHVFHEDDLPAIVKTVRLG